MRAVYCAFVQAPYSVGDGCFADVTLGYVDCGRYENCVLCGRGVSVCGVTRTEIGESILYVRDNFV